MMSHLSTLIMVATLGQVPAESGWLNSVPPEANIVVRVAGLGATKNDLVAMLKAMSPALAAQAEPALEQAVAGARSQASDQAVTAPFLLLIRGVMPEEPGSVPFAIILKSSHSEAVLKSLAGGKDPEIKHLDAGYDSFNGPGGKTWYAAKPEGTIAFGSDKILIGAIGNPGAQALGKTLSPGLQKKFLAGDIGVYLNIRALTTRYAEPIATAKQGLLGTFDNLGPQMGSGMVDLLKSVYGGMFDSIKEADGLALSVDFGGEGLDLSGVLAVKSDSKAIKTIVSTQTSDAAQLTRFSAGSSYYVYMNLSAELFQSIQMMSLQMLSPVGKISPELAATIAKEQGRIETYSSMSLGGGMRSFQISNLSDPRSVVTAYEQMMKLMQGSDSPWNFVKDYKSTPIVEPYRGFSFTRYEMTMDYARLAKLQPTNPALIESMKSMYGGDKITTWLGVGDKQMIQAVTPNWSDARAQIDDYFQGVHRIGDAAGFQATRARLPKQTSILALMSAQGIVGQLTAQFSMMMPNASKLPPADMPTEPAFIGVSLAPAAANALEFQLVVPSTVGPVFEKGFAPVVSSLHPPVKP